MHRLPCVSFLHQPGTDMASSPPPQEVVETLARILREHLEDRRSIHVPNLGTFSVKHRPSRLDPDAEEGAAMLPPKDEIHFEPDSSS